MAKVDQSSVRNLLLSQLEPSAFAALRDLERVPLRVNQPQEQPHQPIMHVYFAESGLMSKVAVTPSGERLEVGIVGFEGMTGMAIVHGNSQSPHETFVEVAGEGVRISAEGMHHAMAANASLRRLFLRFAQAYSIQVSHTALANGRNSLNERLARWLLMSQDRVGHEIPLTHEFLSLMLGVRRAGVTECLQILEGNRSIRWTRRLVEVVDRAKLEGTAGDCYGTPESEYRRLIGIPIRRQHSKAGSARGIFRQRGVSAVAQSYRRHQLRKGLHGPLAREAIDLKVLSLDIAETSHLLEESAPTAIAACFVHVGGRHREVEEGKPIDLSSLRVRSARPRREPAENSHRLPPVHSIISSALARSDSAAQAQAPSQLSG